MMLQHSTIRRLLIITVSILFGGISYAQDTTITITGYVFDSATTQPIPNVNITVEGTALGTSTGTDGRFELPGVPQGEQTLLITHIAYSTVLYTDLFMEETVTAIEIFLTARPILLDEVEVRDTLRTRYIPQFPTSYFVTRDEIQKSGAYTLGDVIKRFIPRTRVREDGGELFIQFSLRRTIAQRYDRNPFPLVIIDGVSLGTSPIGLANLINANQINRLEVLKPPDAEVHFGPEARHGVIIIQTHRDFSEQAPVFGKTTRRLILSGLIVLILSSIVFL